MIRNKRRWRKGEMAKTIVIYCIRILTGVLIWAVALKTLCAVLDWTCDLSDVLTFVISAVMIVTTYRELCTDGGGKG